EVWSLGLPSDRRSLADYLSCLTFYAVETAAYRLSRAPGALCLILGVTPVQEEEFPVARAAAKTTTTKTSARKVAARNKAAKPPQKAAKAATKAAATKSTAKTAKKAVAKSTKASAAATSATLTLRHIAEQLSLAHEMPKRQANEMLTQVVEIITKSLKKGEK